MFFLLFNEDKTRPEKKEALQQEKFGNVLKFKILFYKNRVI